MSFGLLTLQCSDLKQPTELSQVDRKIITAMMKDYQNGWLANDSSTVLALFADTATLIPSGMKPIRGKKEMTQFWWPNDSSKTTIDKYEIQVLEINGSNEWAYAYENGKLSWSYEKGDFKMSKDQESYEITVFRKSSSNWFIVKRIWTDLKK
jgi:ketosteroid isomerase-like protein